MTSIPLPRAWRHAPVTLALALVLGVSPAALFAQDDVADPVDPIEDQALAEESRAQFEQSLETFKQAFGTAVEQAQAGGEARDANLARAEVLLEKIHDLSERTTRQGETAEYLAGMDGEALGPVLKSYVDYRRGHYLRAEGRRDEARTLFAGLGFIRDWWIVGPFDNERGRGFSQSYAPEEGIDLAGEYDGKSRKVKWRQVPVTSDSGYVNLDAMLRPNDQALAYAVALVKSETAQDAALRLGSDEAVKVWLNGSEVLSRKLRRQIAFDQDVVGVRLAAGWNVLLLKMHDETGAWGFRARLTDLEGKTLTGIVTATTPEQAAEALASPAAAEPFEGALAGGARQHFTGVVEGGSASARQYFHLGLLHYERGFENVAKREAETLLRRATELEPDNAVYRFHYGEASSPPTKMAVEKEENKQRRAREEVIEQSPGYAVAYRALGSYYTNSLKNLETAERLIRKALEINPDYHQARMDLARILDRRGLRAEAQLERSKVLDDPKFTALESNARAKASRLEDQGRITEAMSAWNRVLELDARNDGVRRRVAELAARALQHEQALEVLDAIHAANPYSTSSLARKAELLEGVDDFAAATATLRSALAVTPEHDGLLQALARVQLKAGQREEGLATYRQALAVNPKLQSIERYVQFLDPDEVPWEDSYALDLAPLVEKAKGYDNAENDGWVVLLDQNLTKVNVDGTQSSYVRAASKVLNEVGKRRWRQYRAMSWGGQSFKWRHARVLKPDGTIVDAKRRGRMAQFAALEVGDIVDVAYRSDDRSQGFFGDYFGATNYFAEQVPMFLSTYTLITPKEREFYVHTRNFDGQPVVADGEDGTTTVRTWHREDCPKIKSEQGMPARKELYPQVQISSFQDWSAFAIWYWELIKDQHIASDDIKAKVAELVEGKETRYEKIRAIYEFVTGEITYQAWAFGVHGYQPYTTTAIFDKREGDCKDKSILFNTMLREIGIDAQPVLIWASQGGRSEEDMTLPMVNHFNHCISYVPDADGNGRAMFLDGTAQYHSLELPPMMDRGAKVLLVRPDGGEIVTIPESGPEGLGIDQTWDVTVQADGSATAKGELTFRGDFATIARRMFSVEGQRPLILQGMASQTFGQATLKDFDFDDLTDLGQPAATFRVTLFLPAFAREEGGVRSLPTKFLQMGVDFASMASRPEREHDLVIINPISLVTNATYHLPEGWVVDAAPAGVDIDAGPAGFKATTSHEGGTLELGTRIELRESRVRQADYAAFRKGVNEAMSAMEQTWKVKQGSE